MIKIAILLLSVAALTTSLYLTPKIDAIKCPPNTSLKPKMPYLPTPSSGCAKNKFETTWNKALDPFIVAMNPCCIAHDLCFDSCHAGEDDKVAFKKCNDDFAKCMGTVCGVLPWFAKPLCDSWKLGYMGLLGKLGG